MGMITSRIHRAAGRFNAENRAERVLSKSKPEAAPKHPSTEKYLQEILADNEIKESLSRKNIQLDGFLKDVYVTSRDTAPSKMNPKFGKPSERDRLPQFRGIIEDNELGYTEPTVVPQGKITLRQTMKLLVDYQTDPSKNNLNAVVDDYNLHLKTAENILQYYGSLNVTINDLKEAKDAKLLRKKQGPIVVEIEEGIPKK